MPSVALRKAPSTDASSLYCVIPIAPTRKTAETAAMVNHGRRVTRRPRRAHRLSPSSSASSGTFVGSYTARLLGQKPRRPTIARIAGSSVRLAAITIRMPTALTGPTVLVDASSANTSTSIASDTVKALAMIAGPTRGIAVLMASCLSSCWCNSST